LEREFKPEKQLFSRLIRFVVGRMEWKLEFMRRFVGQIGIVLGVARVDGLVFGVVFEALYLKVRWEGLVVFLGIKI